MKEYPLVNSLLLFSAISKRTAYKTEQHGVNPLTNLYVPAQLHVYHLFCLWAVPGDNRLCGMEAAFAREAGLIEMAEFKPYPFFIRRAVRKYLKKEYGKDEAARLWERTLQIYDGFVREAPDIGGKANAMSGNLYLALADFAKKHGYTEIMPVLCGFDHLTARLMHARLFREHTVAAGSTSCDFWYLGDREA